MRPWVEDHVAMDDYMRGRWEGGDIDLTKRLPSNLILEAAEADPAIASAIGPYLQIAAGRRRAWTVSRLEPGGSRVGEVRVLDLGAVFRRSADGADLGLDADPGPDHVTGELQVLLQWEGGTVEHDGGVAVANALHDLVEGRGVVQVEASDDVAAADHRGDQSDHVLVSGVGRTPRGARRR